MPLAVTACVVMAKYPLPGKVKTRLTVGDGALTPDQAADLHRAFLVHLHDRLSRLPIAANVVCFDPPSAGDQMAALLGPDAVLLPQSDGDLGQRLATVGQQLGALHERLLLLGVDAPDVPDAMLIEAAEMLDTADVVLGPARDGGFWCMAIRGSLSADGGSGSVLATLLADIPWSTGRECNAVLTRAVSLGLSTALASTWDDVDHPPDLVGLAARLAASTESCDRQLGREIAAVLSPVAV